MIAQSTRDKFKAMPGFRASEPQVLYTKQVATQMVFSEILGPQYRPQYTMLNIGILISAQPQISLSNQAASQADTKQYSTLRLAQSGIFGCCSQLLYNAYCKAQWIPENCSNDSNYWNKRSNGTNKNNENSNGKNSFRYTSSNNNDSNTCHTKHSTACLSVCRYHM